LPSFFRENKNNDDPVGHHADTCPAIFSIVCTVVQFHKQRIFEDLPSVGKIKTVFPDIFAVLVFVSFELHCSYNNNYIMDKVNNFFISNHADRFLSAGKPQKDRLLTETFCPFSYSRSYIVFSYPDHRGRTSCMSADVYTMKENLDTIDRDFRHAMQLLDKIQVVYGKGKRGQRQSSLTS
jgi:hypothetical protein